MTDGFAVFGGVRPNRALSREELRAWLDRKPPPKPEPEAEPQEPETAPRLELLEARHG